MITKQFEKKYQELNNPSVLYNEFKVDFFKAIDETPDGTSNQLIKDWYNNHSFEKVRIYLEDRVERWEKVCLRNTMYGVNDPVDNMAYREWKKIDNLYTLFYNTYTDMLQLNLGV